MPNNVSCVTYASETWEQVKDEFDVLGKANFEECRISEGKRPYSLDKGVFEALDKEGLVHLTTARHEHTLVGYVLSFLTKRHLQFEGVCSQTIAIYLLPDYRVGNTAIHLMEADEANMQRLGVEKMYGGCTMAKDLEPLFRRRGWEPAETVYIKWIGEK